MRIHHNPPAHKWASPSAPMFDSTRANRGPRIRNRAENGKGDVVTKTQGTYGGPECNGLADFQPTYMDAETGERLKPTRVVDPTVREFTTLTRWAHKPHALRRTVARLRRPDGSTVSCVLRAFAQADGRIKIKSVMVGQLTTATASIAATPSIDAPRKDRVRTNYGHGNLSNNYTARAAQSGKFWEGGYGR